MGNQNTPTFPFEESDEVSLFDIFNVFWQQKKFITVTVIIFTAVGFLFALIAPRTYRSQTSLLILPPLSNVQGVIYSPDTYKQLALASDLLNDVIKNVYPQNAETNSTPTVSGLQQSMTITVNAEASQQNKNALKDFPGIFPLNLQVTFKGENPAKLKEIASTWSNLFIARNSKLFESRVVETFNYVNENYEKTEKSLREVENSLTSFKKENPVPLLQAKITTLQELYTNYTKNIAIKKQLVESKKSEKISLQKSLAQEPLKYTIERGMTPEALWQATTTGNLTKNEMKKLSSLVIKDEILNSNHIIIKKHVADLSAEIDSLDSEITFLEKALQNTMSELIEKRNHLLDITEKEQVLERRASILKESYLGLAKKLEETKIAKIEVAEPIRIVEAPIEPMTPIAPKRKVIVALSSLLGIFIALFGALMIHTIQYRHNLIEQE